MEHNCSKFNWNNHYWPTVRFYSSQLMSVSYHLQPLLTITTSYRKWPQITIVYSCRNHIWCHFSYTVIKSRKSSEDITAPLPGRWKKRTEKYTWCIPWEVRTDCVFLYWLDFVRLPPPPSIWWHYVSQAISAVWIYAASLPKIKTRPSTLCAAVCRPRCYLPEGLYCIGSAMQTLSCQLPKLIALRSIITYWAISYWNDNTPGNFRGLIYKA